MEEKINVNKNTLRNVYITVAICVAVFIVAIAVVFGFSAATLSSDKIYQGVYIGDLSVGNMTPDEAKTAVLEHYTIDTDSNLNLICGDEKRTISVESLSPAIVPDDAVNEAFSLGRTGSVFAKLKDINRIKKETQTVLFEPSLNEDVLLEAIRSISEIVNEPESENSFEITDNELIIKRGHGGKIIIEENALKDIKQNLLQTGEHTVTLTPEMVNPEPLTADLISEKVCGEAQDASYTVENYKLTIVDEKIGVTMDKAEAERIISASNDDIIRIPITTHTPEITAEELRSTLFADRLGTYSSRYNSGDVNRSYNVALACKNINEIVLAPGDVFSYNDIVGPRTAARGFKVAHVYVGNKVEDGIGGGICQVSSTLYNTVVLSDLEIVTRTNHSLPVSYVPMGRDATVSYGSIDFKFKNNTNAPIKVVGSASGGVCTVSIYGNKANPGRTVSIESVCIATNPAELEQKEDPTLPAGTINVEQAGSNGATYQTYKVISENGSVVSRNPLAKSVYVKANRIEIVGTMPTEAPAENDVAANAQPSETDAAVAATPDTEISESTPASESEAATDAEIMTEATNNAETNTNGLKPVNPAA
ncbi:MAG: VanW family protein [Clostridia bacterium]|nr:VanW family protein [Clostridia bacterium]